MRRVNLSLLRTMVGQGFPNKSSCFRFFNIKETKNMFKISHKMHKSMKEVLKVWSDHWPCLNLEKLRKYEKYFINVLTKKKDIAGGRIERIFLKDDIFYKKMENTRLNNEVYSYICFEQDFPKLMEFIPRFHGIASLERAEKYMEIKRRVSFVNCTEKSLKRLEVLNYSKVKRKKRKKPRYIDRIKLKNEQNRELFNHYREIKTSLSLSPSIRSKKQRSSQTEFDSLLQSERSKEDFIIKDFDIVKEFREFPSISEIWDFNAKAKSGAMGRVHKPFPQINKNVRQVLIKSKIKKKILEVLQGKFKYYLALENLLKDDSYSVLDIKLNLVKQEKKFLMTDANHRYKCPPDNKTMKIVGLIVKSASGKVLLNLTKGCSYFDYNIQKRFINKLFEYSPGRLDVSAVTYCISFLERLKCILLEYKLVPVSSSIVVFYSAKYKAVDLKLVDFANIPTKMISEAELLGLTVFLNCLKEIKRDFRIASNQ